MEKSTKRIIEGGQSLFEDLGNGMTEVTIVSPIKWAYSAREGEDEGYMLMLQDALGYEHYWSLDGSYDGWGMSPNE